MSKPTNKSMKRKIILLLSHEEKGNEKEKSPTLNEHNGKDPLLLSYFENILTVLTAFTRGLWIETYILIVLLPLKHSPLDNMFSLY